MNTISLEQIKIHNEKGDFLMITLLQELKTILTSELPSTILLSFLFGSYVRQEATKDSDVDICLIYDESKISEMDINLIVDAISNDLMEKYGVLVNILCFRNSYYEENKEISPLFQNIKKEGVVW